MSLRPEISGFTLAEAVISVALLLLVIGGSYTLVNRSQALIYSARNHYVAINIAKSRLERARDFSYDQLINLNETNIVVNDNGVPAEGGYFRRSTTVNTNILPGLTKIEVRADIRNSKTLTFKDDYESVASLYTEYLTQ